MDDLLTDKHWSLSAPSEGTLKAVRRLIDDRAEDATDVRSLLRRWWPKADPKAVETILTYWIDATTPHEWEPSPAVAVTPICRGRIVDDDRGILEGT
jgi:hypothetical protein